MSKKQRYRIVWAHNGTTLQVIQRHIDRIGEAVWFERYHHYYEYWSHIIFKYR